MKQSVHKAPSRVKYEKKHPVVSFRTTEELKEKLDELQAISGKSLADILQEAVGLQGPSDKESFHQGFKIAEDFYRIVFKCSICGGNEEVFGPHEKKAVAELLRSAGWGHSRCLQQNK